MPSNLIKTRFALALALTCVTAGVVATSSFASGPAFRLYMSTPHDVSAGDELALEVAIQNVGDSVTTGPITFTDTFGGGLTSPQPVESDGSTSSGENVPVGPAVCEPGVATVTCVSPGALAPGAQMFMPVRVKVRPEAVGTLTGAVSVSGGGTIGVVHGEQRMTVGPLGQFEFTGAEVQLLNADGSSDVQAASDPADYTTTLQWRSFESEFLGSQSVLAPVERFKDVIAHLPPGMIGNPSATALCTADELAEYAPGYKHLPNCPIDSQIGVAHVNLGGKSWFTWIYNMVAPYGVAAELGFQIYQTNVLLNGYVRPGDHGIDIISRNTSTTAPVPSVDITVWGNPADPSHDVYRAGCLESGSLGYDGPNGATCVSAGASKAFLRNPTSCSGSPLEFGAESNSYQKPDTWITADFLGPTMTGCEAVPFSPNITVDPTSTTASSPTGVSVKLSLPQNQNQDGLAEADLKKAVVTLPEGMAINPSSADGLAVCDDAHLHLDSNTPADCPDGSKVGTVLLHTQLIPNPIEGSIYLRTQNSSDPASGEMFRMAIELRDDAHGLDFKVSGQISANPTTGRLTTTFDNNPQFPFEDISLSFKAGARAPLVTPASCLTQTTEASLYSWAQPDVPIHQSSSFNLTSGADGTACPPPVPFNPSFIAGVGNVEAGNYTPFLATFSRADADQSMQRVSVKLPNGLLGSLVGLPLCPEPQASQGTCAPESQIGTVTAGAGAGPTPFYVTGGKVYMTGPYKGSPFGLSVVVPAKAGPFDLGTVVVRSKVEVDIHTAQLTVTTDPLPQIVGGVPVNLRLVNVTVNRPNFTYNPTDCDHTEVVGTMTGGQGATVSLSKGFQVTNCGALGFKPKFTVSTSSKTSRANGASLDAKLAYPKTPLGSQANIAKVKVSLPKQLPSRLTTLQKACTADTFETNPAACPAQSRIGTAVANTPVLPVPLTGPVYFVSHGGQAFPDLIIVLQGYGVTVNLVGTTFISKTGITSTTFRQVPDVPIGDFELKLPQGRYSALAANGDLCKAKLVMPTAFVAQDGAEIHQATPISVTGCKPAVTVLRHTAKGRAVTIVARVPSAGRLVASGVGLSQAATRMDRAGNASLTLVLSRAKRRLLSSHPGRSLSVAVKLLFTSTRGSRISSGVTVLMR